MLLLKRCPRCRGDLADEEWLGQVDLACIQCGHRVPIADAEWESSLAEAGVIRPAQAA